MAWVLLPAFKTYVRNEKGLTDDSVLQGALDAAHLAISDRCQRGFDVASATPSARLYAPSGFATVRIHDCTTVTAVTVSGTAVTTYQKEPVGGLTWAGEVRPFEQLRYLGSTWTRTGYEGEATISVTGTWGWAATPAPIIEATKVLAKDIAANRNQQYGLVNLGEMGAAAMRRNPFVAATIDDYRRVEAFGIA